MPTMVQLVGLLFLILLLLSIENSEAYRISCDIRQNPVVTLVLENGTYVPSNATSSSNGTSPKSIADFNQTSTLENSPPFSTQVRYCDCWSPITPNGDLSPIIYYCPVERSHCVIDYLWGFTENESKPECVDESARVEFVRRIWPVLNFMFVLLALFLLCSSAGHQVFACFPGTLLPHWNAGVVRRMIEERPDQANSTLVRYFRYHARLEQTRNATPEDENRRAPSGRGRIVGFRPRPPEPRLNLTPSQMALFLNDPNNNLEDILFGRPSHRSERDATPKPVSLSLKTRIYQNGGRQMIMSPKETATSYDNESLTDMGDQNEVEVICSICYVGIEGGHRVGVLPHCDHIYHVECLKVWLARRNVCPLCLDENIAVAHYGIANNDSTTVAESD